MTTLSALDRLPPHDVEAEEAVIASLLVDSEAVYRVTPILRPGDFFREKNGWVWSIPSSMMPIFIPWPADESWGPHSAGAPIRPGLRSSAAV